MTFADALFACDLIYFRTRDGRLLYKLTRNIDKPPSVAVTWSTSDRGPWSSDFGGQWLEKGDGKMFWRPAR